MAALERFNTTARTSTMAFLLPGGWVRGCVGGGWWWENSFPAISHAALNITVMENKELVIDQTYHIHMRINQ